MDGDLDDCLLHVEHHDFAEECFKRATEHFSRHITGQGMTPAQAREVYQLDYEAECLFEALVLNAKQYVQSDNAPWRRDK